MKTPLPPEAAPLIRTIAMPGDTNPAGDIFGGWLMAQMDLAAGNAAARRARGRCAKVSKAFSRWAVGASCKASAARDQSACTSGLKGFCKQAARRCRMASCGAWWSKRSRA